VANKERCGACLFKDSDSGRCRKEYITGAREITAFSTCSQAVARGKFFPQGEPISLYEVRHRIGFVPESNIQTPLPPLAS